MESHVRQAGFWEQDLADRSFENEIKAFLRRWKVEFRDHTRELHKPDFEWKLYAPGKQLWVAVEAKEKRQHLRPGWVQRADGVTETDLLVVDEVACRKLLVHAPASFLVFQDQVGDASSRYVVYTLVDLFCMPRRRLRRPIEKHVRQFKGKWLLSKRDGVAFADFTSAFQHIRGYAFGRLRDELLAVDCHGSYHGEEVAALD